MSQNTCQIKAILWKDTSGHQHMEGMWSPDNYSDSNATEMKQAHTRTHTHTSLSLSQDSLKENDAAQSTNCEQ